MSAVKKSQGQKFILDMGPLLAFFLVNWWAGIYWATAVLMVGTLAALATKYYIAKKLSKFDIIAAVFIIVFGAAAIYFQDRKFLVAKVTFVELLFAGILLGGLRFGKLFIRDLMGEAIEMPDAAWKTLTIRWSIFFVAVAILNLLIYNYFADYWVTFKVFGLFGLTMLFVLANAPFMAKYIKD